MVEDSVLKGNQDNLRDLMIMHSGDPSALNRIMTQAQQDLGLNLNYSVDGDGHGQLRVASATHFVTTASDGSQTFGDIKNGQDVKASNGSNVQQYLQNLSRDAQQYTQQRFR